MLHTFAYRISITNNGDHTLKLLRRHWHITDLLTGKKEVEGEGVVGQQPIIEPGQKHVYLSGVAIESAFGHMYGTYLMERLIDGKQFRVNIPAFNLIAAHLLN
jgi:ApaG protein